jgi:tRNA pseudouridine55 synthase
LKVDYAKIPLVFNVYKPPGPSSFQVVYHFKKNLNYDFGKIGHFGTLDPFAEGVLLIGVQGAQRLNELVHELMPKTYRATGIFGKKTSTGDFTSPVLEEKDIEEKFRLLSKDDLEEFFGTHFLGEYWQSPHSVSASKHEGKRLYKLAMAGKVIVKEKVKREVYELVIHSFDYPKVDFSVKVSTGTYVRSLFEEMSELVGGLGALQSLQRTGIGHLSSENALTEADWPKKNDEFLLERHGIKIDELLRLKGVYLNKAQSVRYAQGHKQLFNDLTCEQSVRSEDLISQDYCFVYSHERDLMGLARIVNNEVIAIFNLKIALDRIIDQ